MSDKTDNYIELINVHKSFGPKNVLDGISLNAVRGKSLVIMGGSGSGKSVTLKCILGLIKPDEGEILVNDKNVVNMREREREAYLDKFGMLFQGGALFDSLSVWENVAFRLLQNKTLTRNECKDQAIDKLAQVGLASHVAELSPAELSGGMQKRVGLARAIATNPEVIFFDEPTTGLDPIMADVINRLIVDCVKSLGATAVSITHDMQSARVIADQVAMIYKGKIIWHGDVGDIDHSGNEYMDQFIHGRAEGPIKMEILRT
jgi:phospholipid/cholesterol/gamma-HCH transport system ATP-binding protein